MSDPQTDAPAILIWADGACSGNPGPGGWCYLKTLDGFPPAGAHGGEPDTTNNRMELVGVIQGIRSIPEKRNATPVAVHSDSAYVVNAMNGGLARWQTNGWRTASKDPVKNRDLWETLAELVDSRAGSTTFVHVPAHTELDDANAYADGFAKGARDWAKTATDEFSRKLTDANLAAFAARSA